MPLWSDPLLASLSGHRFPEPRTPGYNDGQNIGINPLTIRNATRIRCRNSALSRGAAGYCDALFSTFATGISPMAPLNLTNVSSAITDEAKDTPMRTIRIDANKLFFITSPSFPFLYTRLAA